MSACTRSVQAIATQELSGRAGVEQARADCRIEGRAESKGFEELFGTRDDREPVARFNHSPLTITVRDVPSVLGERVGIRAATESGFALEGWLACSQLRFSAKKRIPLVSHDVAWIPAGARLELRVGDGAKVVVSLKPKTLEPVEAMVSCNDLAVGPVPFAASFDVEGDKFNLTGDSLAVSATTDGPPVFTLRPKSPKSFDVHVEDVGGSMRLRFHDGIAVTGWVDRSELKPASLRWKSFGGGCGAGVSMRETLKEDPVRAARVRRPSSIHVGPDPFGPSRGDAAAGASVVVLSELSGYARVVPRCYELVPASAFWIWLADLDVDSRPIPADATEC